jgi:RNA polymerase sigma-54 factor
VRSYFKELAGKKFSTISKALQMDNRDVKKAVNTITRLNPKPGAVFDDQSHAATLVPDVLISMRGNKISLLLNEKDLPRLRINLRHRKLLENPDTPQKTKQFIIQQLKKALWLIKSVRQRRINTLKVLNALAGAQKAAIFGDLSQLKPLTLKDIALKTQLHVSTVSRIIADKYAETPQGIMKLKDLFSAKLASSKQGKEAAKGARFKISKIILSENKTRPLTDTDISRILKKRGTSISRRTVAKYRNQLKIPPAFLR